MDKELKAFENIMRIYGETNSLEGTYNDFLTIKKALQRLEQIDNSSPSEALEYMKTLFKCWENLAEKDNLETKEIELEKYIFKENYDTIKQALIKTQEQENARAFDKDIINLNKALKQAIDEPILYASRYGNKYIVPQELFENQEKVLKIIENKNVDIIMIRMSETLDEYNRMIYKDNFNRKELIEEEFDTLKRWVENEN